MTRVGWIVDEPTAVGGAELTQAEFLAAAPAEVEVVPCPAGDVDPTCDRYAVHNCVQYTIHDIQPIVGRPVVKYHHDVGPWIQPELRGWLSEHATHVCCSPIQADYMGLTDAVCIPPPIDVARFEAAGRDVNGSRRGSVCVASWCNHGKAPHRAAEWAASNGGVDFYGGGMFAPSGSVQVAYDAMPELLARYDTFVYLPTVLEPFGRLVAEAWAAGCRIVTNDLVGAGYWIREAPGSIETAARDFWRTVLDA